MKVTIPTQEFPPKLRRAIRAFHGMAGLASREECRDWFLGHGTADDDDILDELELNEPAWAEDEA